MLEPNQLVLNELIEKFNTGNFQEAEYQANEITQKYPTFALGWKVLGAALQQNGNFGEAINSMRKAIELEPEDIETYKNLGIAYKQSGQLSQATEILETALKYKKDYVEVLIILSQIYREIGSKNKSLKYVECAYQINTEKIEIINDLAILYIENGEDNKAEELLLKIINKNIKIAEVYNNLGSIKRNLKDFMSAKACFEEALNINKKFYQAYNNLGVVLVELKEFYDAKINFEKAIEINNNYFEAYSNLGSLLKDLSDFNGAIINYKKALDIKPDFMIAYSNLLFCLNYINEVAEEERKKLAINYGLIATNKANKKFEHTNFKLDKKKLKVGMVSADFINHPVGYFLENILKNINKDIFQLYAYSNNNYEDDLTNRIKKYFKKYKKICNLNDLSAAKLINEDGIDILIDLSGHTANNRLPVFSFKPSPVQMTWLGYFATTGVTEIDYLIGDPYVTPVSEWCQYSEKILQLPETYLCFTPPEPTVQVLNLPALTNGYVTFGCFNNLTKIGENVIELWIKILKIIESSKIFIKAKQLNDPIVRELLIKKFLQNGIQFERIILEGFTDRIQYLNSYNKIDIALDPFPFPGGTTAVEGLWMGVPVITMKGNRFIAHNGETIAVNSGQSNWIAKNEDEYIEKAIFYASNLEILKDVRSRLREQILNSPLMNAPRFARNFEALLQKTWKEHTKNEEF